MFGGQWSCNTELDRPGKVGNVAKYRIFLHFNMFKYNIVVLNSKKYITE